MRQRIPSLLALLGLVLVPVPGLANDPFLLNDYALSLQAKGDYPKALEKLQEAYRLYPYDETLKKNLAETYTVIGNRQMEQNRFDEAAETFDRARELYPEAARYGTLRGIALYHGKRYDAALYEFERARGIAGDTPDVLYYLGKVRYDTGDLAGALEVWERILERNPDNAKIRELADKVRREQAVEARMEKGYSGKFTISYDAQVKMDLADEILKALEDAYNRVGSDLTHYPTAKVPVLLYTKKDYRSITAGPDWSGGLYDGKIRLPIGGAEQLTPQLREVLFHEYTHVVVREITGGNCPTWLNEGLAELQGRREVNRPLPELGKALKNGGLLPMSTLEGPFMGLSAREAALAYQQSYALVNFLVTQYGWHKVKEMLVALGSGLDTAAAVKRALGDYGLDYPAVIQEWRAYLQKEYGAS
jgi:tetratricopeptide (TPR) repeat protein